jgi:hypothetical protein
MGDRLLLRPIERVFSKVKPLERGEEAAFQSIEISSVRMLGQIDRGIDNA